MQRIPWPTSDDIMNGVNHEDKRWLGHDTWLLNDEDFPWLKATDGVFIKHFTFTFSNLRCSCRRKYSIFQNEHGTVADF